MNWVELRPANTGDLELLLAWRSNPEIYKHFRNQDNPLRWEEHVEWFVNRSPERRDYMIEYVGRRVGSIAVTENGGVSVYIGETALWGEGVASEALSKFCEDSNRRKLYAEIHKNNDASRRLFESCGFDRNDREGDWLIYCYAP